MTGWEALAWAAAGLVAVWALVGAALGCTLAAWAHQERQARRLDRRIDAEVRRKAPALIADLEATLRETGP